MGVTTTSVGRETRPLAVAGQLLGPRNVKDQKTLKMLPRYRHD